MHSDVVIIIPSRIGSTRLARKALLPIGDMLLIEHVISRLKPVNNGNLYVATDSAEIAKIADAAGAIAIMTDQNCQSGSDRVFEALCQIPEHDKIEYIINVQGDMPFIDVKVVNQIITMLRDTSFDIVTPAVNIGKELAQNSSNVKLIVNNNGEALYFSRSMIPYDGEEFLYHVGIYGFRRQALEKFVKLAQGQYEQIEKLEQLRALEHGMKIGVCFSNEIPISVDTIEDLEKACKYNQQWKR